MEKLKEILKDRNVWIVIILVAFVIVFIIAIRKYNRDIEQESNYSKIKRDAIKDKVTEKEQELNNYMRKLWSDNAYWTRNYIISYLSGGKDVRESATRLLKNQEQIGRAMGMWYGKEAGKRITLLLQKNGVSFGDMLSAMVGKKKNDAIVAEKRWNDNTESLASYLNSLNPKFDKTDITSQFKKYNDLMTTQAIARYRGKHATEINTFDKTSDYSMYDLADTISKGIVAQFPEKFDREPVEEKAPAPTPAKTSETKK